MKIASKKMNVYLRCYRLHDTEFNLARNFKEIIEKAIKKHVNEPRWYVATVLGISERTLYTIIKAWKLDVPAKWNPKRLTKKAA